MPDVIDRTRARIGAKPDGETWFQIFNAATPADVAEVYLYDEIGIWGITAADFVQQLQAVAAAEIQLHIHSPGGDVFDGIAILNALRMHDARIVATVDGLAASAASFIAMAGDEIVMAPNAEMMVHEPWGVVVGNAADCVAMADDLNRLADNIASIYAGRAGGTIADWRTVMGQEVWYTAEEAVTAGLADRVGEITKPKKAAQPKAQARFDLSIFNFAGRREAPGPQHLVPGPGPEPTNPERTAVVDFTTEQLNSLRQRFGLADDADETTVRDAVMEGPPPSDPPPDVPPPTPLTPLPEGLIAVDAAALAALRADAAAGREARAQQLADRRAALIQAAVKDGRIPPARREAWMAQLEADPGAEQVLAGLAKGLVPVDQIGASGAGDLETIDAEYEALFGKDVLR